MKETPILFNGEMVRAISEGRKTQTRRIVSSVAGIGPVTEFQRTDTPSYDWAMRDKRMLWNELRHIELLDRCPLGRPGDRLYVRESTWVDRDTGEFRWYVDDLIRVGKNDNVKQRPSIHMLKTNARFWLEITEIRVQLLQEISGDDAEAEGVNGPMCARFVREGVLRDGPCDRMGFAALWESVYGNKSWDDNPWVWAITFKRVLP